MELKQELEPLIQDMVLSAIGRLGGHLKHDTSTLAKPAFDEMVDRLESLKQKGGFSAFDHVLEVTERMGTRLQSVDLARAQPVRGIFGMMAALKRPEVQEGLGVLVELATVISVLKEPREKTALYNLFRWKFPRRMLSRP